MEDGRWKWKSRVREPETRILLDKRPLQKNYDCIKCGKPITKPPFYRVRRRIPILKGWEWKWVWEDAIIFIDLKALRLFFHEKCYSFPYLDKRFEVHWIP